MDSGFDENGGPSHKEHRRDYHVDDVVKATVFLGLFIEHVVMFIPCTKKTSITTFEIQEKAISRFDISHYHVRKSCVKSCQSCKCKITIVCIFHIFCHEK